MTPAELEKLALAQSNPFLDSVLRNGFEQPLSDVPEIHAGVREKLRALVEAGRGRGALRLQVVTGEPGDGKTPLLATLRAEAEESWLRPGTERAMVPIEPVRDPDAPFTHMLRALVAGLSRPLAKVPLEGPSTPIEFILWRILTRAVRSVAGDGELAEVNRLLPEPEGHPGLVAAAARSFRTSSCDGWAAPRWRKTTSRSSAYASRSTVRIVRISHSRHFSICQMCRSSSASISSRASPAWARMRCHSSCRPWP